MSGRHRHFTLLELAIAVTIFMMVAVALFAFSGHVSSSWGSITTERNRQAELLAMDRTLDSILSNAVPFLWREREDGIVQVVPFIVAEADVLRIAYLHRLNDTAEGSLRFVELFLEDGELKALYTDRPFINWEDIADDRKKVSVISTGVESISFLYADFSSDVSEAWRDRLFWRDSWETEDSGRKDIPLAIQIRVKWQDGREESWLRRTMGNSYRERYGTFELPVDNTP
jgi:type II secretory pathway component PulJ